MRGNFDKIRKDGKVAANDFIVFRKLQFHIARDVCLTAFLGDCIKKNAFYSDMLLICMKEKSNHLLSVARKCSNKLKNVQITMKT